MLESKWSEILKEEKDKDYFKQVLEFSINERKNKNIFPPQEKVF